MFAGRGEEGAIAVDVDGVHAGAFDIADQARPEAADVDPAIAQMRVEVWMITGDSARVAREVAREVGIVESRVLAEVLPQDKEREVARLKSEGKRVAMVGDGINDAPALARADVGIAIGTGTDVAIDAAGIILMRGDLRGVPEALALARQTLRVIRQNLFWAFAYNAIGIPDRGGRFVSLHRMDAVAHDRVGGDGAIERFSRNEQPAAQAVSRRGMSLPKPRLHTISTRLPFRFFIRRRFRPA